MKISGYHRSTRMYFDSNLNEGIKSMNEKATFLFFVQRQSYKIQIKAREKGYNFCSYRIITTDEYRLWESSMKKIFQRLVITFSLYIDQFSESEINDIIHDLEVLSKKLMISEKYAKSKILQLRGEFS